MKARALTVAAAATVLAACADSTSPADRFAITMTASRTSIKAGDTVYLALTLHNRSDQTVQTSVGCFPPYIVLDSQGVEVGPGSRSCELALYAPVVMAPGTSKPWAEHWEGDSLGGAVRYLAPGTYRIRPRIGISTGEDHFAEVFGDDVAITVTPP